MSSRVYQAVFGPDDSRKGPIWNVGWTKIDASFEFCVVDARIGTTLLSRALKPGAVAPVLAVIEQAMRQHGKPWAIRSESSREFTHNAFGEFLASHGIEHVFLPPFGRPTVRKSGKYPV
jgi:hypothetical protein